MCRRICHDGELTKTKDRLRRHLPPPHMKWGRYWLEILLAILVVALQGLKGIERTHASNPLKGAGWTAQRKLAARYVTVRLILRCTYL